MCKSPIGAHKPLRLPAVTLNTAVEGARRALGLAVVAIMLKCGIVVAATAAVGIGLVPALATPISRGQLERRLLDTCVYRQYEVDEINRQSMIDNCRCAAEKAMTHFEGDSFEEPRSGGLTGPQDQAIRAAISACFKG